MTFKQRRLDMDRGRLNRPTELPIGNSALSENSLENRISWLKIL
jgi:hypothetical protein